MARFAAILLALLGLCPTAAAASRASVKVLACTSSPLVVERTATFEARMRAIPGSARMQLLFTLEQRGAGSGGWRRVAAPGFDVWLPADPGVRRYTYARTVQNLAAPARYRTVVRFRWRDAAGSVIARRRAASAACRQPDLRPDLRAVRVVALAGGGLAVTVVNSGHADAGSFLVAATLPGVPPGGPITVPGLAAGTRRVVELAVPACVPGTPLEVVVDPAGAVDERTEDDNVLSATCPGA